MSKRYLTLDIGASSVKLAEFEGGRGALTLVNYGIAALAAPLDAGNAGALLSPALLEIVREKGIKPGPVSVSVSGQMVFPRFAAIPAAGGSDKFDQQVRFEIEQNIPFPIDEMICDRQVLGDSANGDKNVMIVAAKTDQIEDIVAAVRGAGFTPEIVDVAPIAVTNVLKCVRPDEGCCVILDIGAKTTSLVIAEGDSLYNRSIPVAGNTITKEIASALGCSPDEAAQYKLEGAYVALGGVVEDDDETRDRVSKVCRAVMTRLHAEVSRSINFYRSQQGGGVPTKLYLTGGTSLLPQVDGFFAESLQLEVEYVNPFEAVGVGPKVDGEALEGDGVLLAAAAGVALHAAGAAPFAINLLPPSLVKERADIAKIPFVAVGCAALVAALALVMMTMRGGSAAAEAERDAVRAKASSLRSAEDAVKKADEAVRRELARADALSDLFRRRTAAVDRLRAVRQALEEKGSRMWIEKWEGDNITVRVWKDDTEGIIKGCSNEGVTTVDEVIKSRLAGYSATTVSSSSIGKDNPLMQIVMTVTSASKSGKGDAR